MNLTQALYALLMIGLALLPQLLSVVIDRHINASGSESLQ